MIFYQRYWHVVWCCICSVACIACTPDKVEEPASEGALKETCEYAYEVVLGDTLLLAPETIPLGNDLSFAWYVNGEKVACDALHFLFAPTACGKYIVKLLLTTQGASTEWVYTVQAWDALKVELPPLAEVPITGKVFTLTPRVQGPQGVPYQYRWQVDHYRLGCTDSLLHYATTEAGTHTVSVEVIAGTQKAQASIEVEVAYYRNEDHPDDYYSFYAQRYAYVQAPFYHTTWEDGETFDTYYKGVVSADNTHFYELGSWGSSLTVAFDHVVPNYHGKPDFHVTIDGDAVYWVEVAYDKNGNQQPDEDEWYTVYLPYANHSAMIENYQVRYTLQGEPSVEQDAEGDYVLKCIIAWEDNQGRKGTFESDKAPGYRLKDGQLVKHEGWATTTVFEGKMLDVDRVEGKLEKELKIELSNAVDAAGNPVYLPGIHFVRYTHISARFGKEGVLTGSDRIVNVAGFSQIGFEMPMVYFLP